MTGPSMRFWFGRDPAGRYGRGQDGDRQATQQTPMVQARRSRAGTPAGTVPAGEAHLGRLVQAAGDFGARVGAPIGRTVWPWVSLMTSAAAR